VHQLRRPHHPAYPNTWPGMMAVAQPRSPGGAQFLQHLQADARLVRNRPTREIRIASGARARMPSARECVVAQPPRNLRRPGGDQRQVQPSTAPKVEREAVVVENENIHPGPEGPIRGQAPIKNKHNDQQRAASCNRQSTARPRRPSTPRCGAILGDPGQGMEAAPMARSTTARSPVMKSLHTSTAVTCGAPVRPIGPPGSTAAKRPRPIVNAPTTNGAENCRLGQKTMGQPGRLAQASGQVTGHTPGTRPPPRPRGRSRFGQTG